MLIDYFLVDFINYFYWFYEKPIQQHIIRG